MITSAVQLGFIVGTFFYAVFQLADRYSPSKVFLWSSLAAGAVNVAMLFAPLQLDWILGSRFLTGFFLGGIYPVGMKIAADYTKGGLGVARQLKDELFNCPPVLVMTARKEDAWLATWSRAEANVLHPIDPFTLAHTAADLLRSSIARIKA
jgi:hypothetical protein